jgi:hypothetical protein
MACRFPKIFGNFNKSHYFYFMHGNIFFWRGVRNSNQILKCFRGTESYVLFFRIVDLPRHFGGRYFLHLEDDWILFWGVFATVTVCTLKKKSFQNFRFLQPCFSGFMFLGGHALLSDQCLRVFRESMVPSSLMVKQSKYILYPSASNVEWNLTALSPVARLMLS